MMFVFRCWLTSDDVNHSFMYDVKNPSDQMMEEDDVKDMFRRNFGIDPDERGLKVLKVIPLTYIPNPETVRYRKTKPKLKDIPYSPNFGYLRTPYYTKGKSKKQAKKECAKFYDEQELLNRTRQTE